MRAFSYIRFSSPEQSKGHSLERQLERTRAYCDKHQLQLDETLKMRDLGVSGFMGNNVKKGALGGFVQLVKDGKIQPGSILILENIDRLGRDQVGEALKLFITILGAGIRIVTLNPEREYTSDSINDIGNLLVPIIDFSRAFEESKRKSDLVGAAWHKKKERARAGTHKVTSRCPYWLRLAEDRTVYEAIPERAEAVRQIFQMALQGMGAAKIARHLNTTGVATFTPKPWNVSYVSLILRSKAVLGHYQPVRWNGKSRGVADGELIQNYFPRVVDDETFYRAQSVVTLRDRNPTRGQKGKHITNIFRGILFDARSGFPMNLIYVSKPLKADIGRKLFKLIPAREYTGKATGSDGFRYDHFEAAFLRHCRDELRPEDFLASADGQGEIVELAGRLIEVADKIRQTSDRISMHKAGDIGVYLDLLGRLQDEKRTIEARLDEARSKSFNHYTASLESLNTYGEMLASNPENHYELREKIRSQVRQLVRAIWILPFTAKQTRIAVVQVQYHNSTSRTFWTSYPTSKCKVPFVLSGTVIEAAGAVGSDLAEWRHNPANLAWLRGEGV